MPPCKLGGYTIAPLRRDKFGFVKNLNEFDGFRFPEDMLLSYVLSGRSLSAMLTLFRHLLLWAHKILSQKLWHRWNEDATLYAYVFASCRQTNTDMFAIHYIQFDTCLLPLCMCEPLITVCCLITKICSSA